MAKENDTYSTPLRLFNRLDSVFHFTFDVCALAENTKVHDNYYTPETDGLRELWTGVCWMKPPVSEMKKWVAKAHRVGDDGVRRSWRGVGVWSVLGAQEVMSFFLS